MEYYAGEYINPVGEPPMDTTAWMMVQSVVTQTGPRTKTDIVPFTTQEWQDSPSDPTKYEIAFFHNLKNRNVAVILDDPQTGKDLSSVINIIRSDTLHVTLQVTKVPDLRCNGTIQCYIP